MAKERPFRSFPLGELIRNTAAATTLFVASACTPQASHGQVESSKTPEVLPLPTAELMVESPAPNLTSTPEVTLEDKTVKADEKVIPVQPTKLPDVTPSPTPEPQETPSPLRIKLAPTKITIPSLGLNFEPIQQSSYVKQKNGDEILSVPPQGIATPNHDIEEYGINKIIWFGHSRWNNVTQPLSKLQFLNPGNLIIVDCTQPETPKRFINLVYVVENIFIADRETLDKIYKETASSPIMIFHTTARVSGTDDFGNPIPWITGQVVEDKAESRIEGDINDTKKYLFVVGIARPNEESFTRFLNFQNSRN